MIGVKDEKLSKAFGKKFKELREKTGMSTREFADTAGIAYSQIWRIETGKGNPTLGTLKAIATTLDIPLTELLKGF
ncbi:helix-turn-helix domain-containing protein [Chitinophaga japonensis]|uniref:Helix-turn-helix protein n=1 Tax=Chitinophaga japonensis TaxID=104662 RepID=A0A562SSP0_CHIJA|nr:helix-turn-helix transcriptional regulator [Chitinophaga japonensis]TWI84277.1 helix-turn-helix protein [Chitinophaga japonensis]